MTVLGEHFMPKSSKKQIDDDEKTFLRVIQQNSGDSIENIAKKCGFSRQKLWRIKKRLEKNNTIWGYNAVIDDDKSGKKRFLVLFKRTTKPIGNAINKIIEIAPEKNAVKMGIDILSVGYMYGEYDIAVVLKAEDIRYVKRFKEILVVMIPGIFSEIKILEYVFLLRDGGITNPEIEKIREFF